MLGAGRRRMRSRPRRFGPACEPPFPALPPPPLPAPARTPSAAAAAAVTSAVPVAVLVVIVGVTVVGVFVLFRLDQVGGVEEGALFGADVDEGGLDARQNGFDLADVDVANRPAGIGTIDQEFHKAVVLENGHAGFPRASRDENLALQSSDPRAPAGSTRRREACGFPSNSPNRPATSARAWR